MMQTKPGPKSSAPKRVTAYECRGCKYQVMFDPCQICEARAFREGNRQVQEKSHGP